MKKICITGGSGFIGTNAMESMISQGFDVMNIDINPPKIISHKSKWVYCDVRN
jgi:nucleoside-diphosphate-sugar epimerase